MLATLTSMSCALVVSPYNSNRQLFRPPGFVFVFKTPILWLVALLGIYWIFDQYSYVTLLFHEVSLEEEERQVRVVSLGST